jgi:hypothetical protein
MDALKREEVKALTSGADHDTPESAKAAQWMKVRVRRDGQTIVELTHAASAVERLASMLDDNLKKRIGATGVDLEALASSVRQSGYRSGPLFVMNEGNKEVKVWLE